MLVDESAPSEVVVSESASEEPPFRAMPRWVPAALGVFVLGVAIVAVIGPVRDSGYQGDDALNFLLRDYLREADSSPWEHIRFYTRDWMENQGRFFPGAVVEGTAVFWFLGTRSLYKGFQFFVVVLDLGLLALVIRQQCRQWAPAFLAVAVVLSSIQFRLYHDAVLSFSGLLPVTLAAVLGTLLVLTAWQRRGWWWLVPIALGLWLFALTAYEIAYFLAPAALVWVLFAPGERRRRIVSAAVVVVPTVVLFGVVLSLRSDAETLAPAYTTRIQIAKMLPTSVYQSVGAVPANVPAFRADPSLGPLLDGHELGWTLLTLVVGSAVAVAVTRLRPVGARTRILLALLGLSLWVAPVMTVAIAQRWQDELSFGFAYLGVYFESFGLGLVFIAALMTAIDALQGLPARFVRPSRIGAALLVGLTVGGLLATTARNNQWVVNQYGRPERIRQTAIQHAARNGLYESLPAGTTLLPADQSTWLVPILLSASGPSAVTTVANVLTLAAPVAATGRCAFASSSFQAPVDLDRGFVVVARPDAVSPSVPPASPIVGSSRLRVFVPDHSSAPAFSARPFGAAPDAPAAPLPRSAVLSTVPAADGIVVDLCLGSALVDVATLTYR